MRDLEGRYQNGLGRWVVLRACKFVRIELREIPVLRGPG